MVSLSPNELSLMKLETDSSGLFGQYHAADALAPEVAKASAGMVLTV